MLDILQHESPIVRGINLPESSGNIEEIPIDEHVSNNVVAEPSTENGTSARKRRRVVHQPVMDEEKHLKIELLKVEIYLRKLKSLALEKELGLPPSQFTKGIINQNNVNIGNVSVPLNIDVVHEQQDEGV